MEITCKNFKQNYNVIENVVKNASFAAIDVEFLGLDPEDAPSRCSLFDSPSLRYEKQAASVRRFPPVQWGVALFTAEDQGQKYKIDVYNVYLFKHGFQRHEYSFSVSSLAFLETHGFDFNKLINEGVSHMNLDELKQIMDDFTDKKNLNDSFGEDLQTLFTQVQNTLHSKLARIRRRSTGSEGAPERSWDCFHLLLGGSELTDLQRAVLLYKLYSTVPGVRMCIAGNLLECSSARLTKRELTAIKGKLLQTITKELVGASDILLAMIEARLPIVGHNCLYDLLYMYHNFVVDLPVDYEEFKGAISTVFPLVIDTKILAEESKHKLSWHGVMNFRLESLGAYFESKLSETSVPSPEFEFGAGFGGRRQQRRSGGRGSSYHNAAYDALTTGQTFIKLAHLVAQQLQSKSQRGQCLPFRTLLYAVRPFANRIPVPLLGVPYINLTGEDPPSRNPDEIVLETIEDQDEDVDTLRKELRAQFGRWRCEARFEGNVIRLATNTDTTYRRVFNYYAEHPSYRVLSGSECSTSTCGSLSSGSTPRRPSSPSCSSLSMGSTESLQIETPSKPLYKWVLCAGSLLLTAHFLSRPVSNLSS